MGQLRINTIARLLEAPREEAALLNAYSAQKKAKLEIKNPGATPQDIYERSCQKNYRLNCQYAAAQRYLGDDYIGELNDTSHKGVSEAVESVFKVRDRIFDAKKAKTPEDLAFVYLELLHAIRDDRNPIVAKTARDALLTIHSQTEKKSRQARFIMPLAVACGLRFHSNLKSERFANIIGSFVDVWFGNELDELKALVKAQYKGSNMERTRQSVTGMHSVLLERYYAKALSGKYGPTLDDPK